MFSTFSILNTLFTLGLYIVILRLWMQFVQVNYYNPCTQFIIKATQPIIRPLRKILPPIGRFDTACLVLLYIIALIKVLVLYKFNAINAPLFDVRYLLYSLYAILHAVGHLIFWLLLIRAVLSWFSQDNSPIEAILYQLTEPFVAPIRRFIPPIGNIDISFMIVVFVLVILNMLATSLFGEIWFYL